MRTNEEILSEQFQLSEMDMANIHVWNYVLLGMKEAQKEIVENILQKAADNAETSIENCIYANQAIINRDSILSLKDEIIKEIENL